MRGCDVGRGLRLLPLVMALGVPLLACKQRKAPDPTPAAATPTVSPNVAKTAELKPKLKKHIDDGVYGIVTKLKKEPKVRANKPLKDKLEDSKVVVVGLPWLEEPSHSAEAGEIPLGNTTLYLCQGHQDDTELSDDQIKWAEECLAWEYLAVVRQRSLKLPKVSKAEHTFDKGSFYADLLLVEIATGDIKGRYIMRITNSDKFTVLDSATQSEIQTAAEKDLGENITGVIGERLRGEIKNMGS
ncbi:MAG: hypothetical protein H6718_09955 [Polyangiaceae bacterium]|nr:hypothetical protein [Myxococcales bacterium]MCB9585713.1 hypothetical protein [Polyangiaceae bacterium]MCB9607358.1 hypothetical protein [Polyangiaceae bacterium]